MNLKDSKEWTIAIKNEVNNMYDINVMIVVDINSIPKKNSNIIHTRWILVIKIDKSEKCKISCKRLSTKGR